MLSSFFEIMTSRGKETAMKKNGKLLAAVLVGILAAASAIPAWPAQDPADQTGFQLLDRLVVALVKAVAPGGGAADFDQNILLLAKDLKSAREAKRVEDLFAVRYSRLLSAVRQAVIQDPEVLFWPMYRFQMIDFIEERTGQMPDWDDLLFMINDHGGSGVGLGALSDAIMSEVVSLHIHLENLTRRPEILKSYIDKGMNGAGAGK
jgi:hypothetical protein